MKQTRSGWTMTGIPSLFLIFAVLTMVILALLTYGNAHTNAVTNETALDQTFSYYITCSEATDAVNLLTEQILNLQASSQTEEQFLDSLPELDSNEFRWNSDPGTFVLTLPYTDTQALRVSVRPSYESSALAILEWNSVSTKDWTPDTHLHLFVPES